MKKVFLAVVAVLSAVVGLHAADGTYVTDAAGNWNDTAKWVDQKIAGGGGVASFTITGDRTVKVDTDVSLSGMNVTAPMSKKLTLEQSGTSVLTLSDGAVVNFPSGGGMKISNANLLSAQNLTVNGFQNPSGKRHADGEIWIYGNQKITGSITLNHAMLSVGNNLLLNADSTEFKADAIVLDGGALYNNAGTTNINEHIGIKVGANGGYFVAGGMGVSLTLNSPITGAGDVYVCHQCSDVKFNNVHNSYEGDTVIGSTKFHTDQHYPAKLVLGQSEVIPNTSTIVLKVDEAQTHNVLTLNGTETVNAITGGKRSNNYISGSGTLILAGDANSSLKAQIADGVTIEKQGSGTFDLTDATYSGALVLKGGETSTKVSCFVPSAGVTLAGGALTFTEGGNFDCPLTLLASSTLTDASAAANPLVLRGIFYSSNADAVLTVDVPNSDKLIISGTEEAPFVFDAKLSCSKPVEFRNGIWLKAPLENLLTGTFTFADSAVITYDYDVAGAETETLEKSVCLVNNARATSTITVPTGKTLVLDTRVYADGAFSDDAAKTTEFGVSVILDGGTLRFTGEGVLNYTGTVTGSGTIEKTGSGAVLFANGSALAATTTIRVDEGDFRLRANGSIGAANFELNGGDLANVDGENLSVGFAVTLRAGGFGVSGADSTLTYTGVLTAPEADFVKDGDGTLFLNCADTSVFNGSVVNGGTLKLGRDVAFNHLELKSTVLDLNGCNCSVNDVKMSADILSLVKNTAETAVTFTAASNSASVYQGRFQGNIDFVVDAEGVVNVNARSKFENAKLTVQKGICSVLVPKFIQADLLRFTIDKTRRGDNWQFQEFYLMKDGVDLQWSDDVVVSIIDRTTGAFIKDGHPLIDGSKANDSKVYVSKDYSVVISATSPLEFDSYTFMTGNDMPGRDPVCWTFEAGVVGNGVTNWMVIAKEVDQENVVPSSRCVRVASYAASWGDNLGVELPAEHEISVAENARLTLDMLRSDISDSCVLKGGGFVELTGEIKASVSAGSEFDGTISVSGNIRDKSEEIRSDIEIGNGTLEMIGTNNTYSGSSRVGNGGVLSAAPSYCRARYLRLTILKTTANDTGYVNPQIGEMDLLWDGEKIDWPEGSVVDILDAATPGSNLIDGKASNKVYWNSGEGYKRPATITLPTIVQFDGYRLYTGNDCIKGYASHYKNGSPHGGGFQRHPVSWVLEYSLDGTNWSVFDRQEDNWTLTRETGESIEMTPGVNDDITFTYADGEVTTVYYADRKDTITKVVDKYNTPISFYNKVFYTFHRATAVENVLSPNSALTLDGVGMIQSAAETVPSLAGAGTLNLSSNTVFTVNPGSENAVFTGTIKGGVLVKDGDSVLCLDGATLDGVTNIVLKGGVLTGTAQTTGDLTVTAAGGDYAATIAVAGALKLQTLDDAAFTIRSGWNNNTVSQSLFTFMSIDDASTAVFNAAALRENCPSGWTFNKKVGTTSLGYSVVPGGTVLLFR